MKKAYVLVMMVAILAVWASLGHGQEQNLMSGDEIIQQLEKKEQSNVKFRAIRIGSGNDSEGAAEQGQVGQGEPAAQQAAQTPPPAPSITFYLYFKTASVELADDFSKRQVMELGKALSSPALANAKIEIGGHTDSRGSEEYNMQLSLRRANAIKDFLVAKFNVNPSNLQARGYGESMPAYSNTTAEGMAKNRRVVVKRLD